MTRTLLLLLAGLTSLAYQVPQSGNPIVPGWYADPEAHVFQNEYWILPVKIASTGVTPNPLR
jgi:hypothetical protein